jgi:predicted nucleotidyltransferase
MDEVLLLKLRAVAGALFAERPILAAYAFGSRVSGQPRAQSDLDVGYYPTGYLRGESLPAKEEMILASRLSEALGVEVDLRNLAQAPLELRGRALEDGVRIFSGNDAERVGLERDLLGRYHDYKETFLRMHEIRLKRTAERGL